MTRAVVVRYETHPEHADGNQALVEKVFAQLHAERPEGISYACFRLAGEAGGSRFVHVAVMAEGSPGLTALSAFRGFLADLDERVTAPPESAAATLVGAYGSAAGVSGGM